jgi:hypothetical protein
MSGDIHKFSVVSNIEKFLVGMRVNTLEFESINIAKHAKNKAIFNRIFDIEDNLRNAYDSLIPNVHILNVDKLTDLVIKHLENQKEFYIKFYNKTIPSAPPSDAEIEDMYKEFVKVLKDTVQWHNMRNSIFKKVSEYHMKIHQAGNPVEELNKLSSTLFNYTNSTYAITDAEAVKLGYDFARQLNNIFGKKAIIGFTDRVLGSSHNTFVFFGKSFNAMKTIINNEINSAITPILNKIITDANIKYQQYAVQVSVGYIANFGHGMVISKDNGRELGRFVNSPGFASSVYGVTKGLGRVAGTTPHDAALLYKEKSGLVTNSIELNKDFDKDFGVLMSLGVTITFPEDYDINQERGRKQEGPSKTSLVEKADFVLTKRFTGTSRTRYTAYLKNIIIKNIIGKHPESAKASRSIIDFISDSIMSILSGRKPATEKERIVKTNSTPVKTITRVKSTAKPIVFANPQVVSPTGAMSFPVGPKLRTTRGQFTSLVSIQNILNQGLASQIEKNMGKGDRRDILNYRSGRFAESARVETMSQSREGMITAFYSYMRNPYATFSFGGAQSSPATRDPKLLISRSIREIGATMVGNRMRAVLV